MECVKCKKKALYKCENCLVPYCGFKCQTVDWPQHKLYCCKLPKLILMGTHHSPSLNVYSNRGHSLPNINIDVQEFPSDSISVKQKDSNEIEDFKNFKWKNSKIPNKGFFRANVQYIENDHEGSFVRFIWITDVQYMDILDKLSTEMELHVNYDNPIPFEDIRVGLLVVARFERTLYRAEILHIHLENHNVTVHLIDRGNKITLSFNNIFTSTSLMEDVNACAIRIKLDEDYHRQEIDDIIEIQIIDERTPNGYYNVECKQKSIPLHLPTDKFSKGASIEFATLFNKGQHALVYLYDSDDRKAFNDAIHTFLETMNNDFNFTIAPDPGTFVAAYTANGWRRCRLIGSCEEEQIFVVYAIDDGRMCLSKYIKRIPKCFIDKPIQAFAISINSIENFTLINTQINNISNFNLKLVLNDSNDANSNYLKTLRQINCGLYENIRKVEDATATVFTGNIDEINLNVWHELIGDGCEVYVSYIVSYKEVYIRAFSTKYYENVFVAEMKNCPPFNDDDTISIGDIVLVTEVDGSCYRGEIIKLNGTYKVLNIDCGNVMDVERHALRKPSIMIRSLPVRCSSFKLMYLEHTYSTVTQNKAFEYLMICKDNMTPFAVFLTKYCNDVIDLLFLTKKRESLCTKLFQKLFLVDVAKVERIRPICNIDNIKEKQEAEKQKEHELNTLTDNLMSPLIELSINELSIGKDDYNYNYQCKFLSFDILTLDDISIIPLKCGNDVPLYILHYGLKELLDSRRLIVADNSNKEAITEWEDNLEMVSVYCSGAEAASETFVPKKHELCLAIFEEDGDWYRAVCLDIEDEFFFIRFLDYGNTSKVLKSQIKPMIKNFMFPTIANEVYVEGTKMEYLDHKPQDKTKLSYIFQFLCPDIETLDEAVSLCANFDVQRIVKANVRKEGEHMYIVKILNLDTFLPNYY